MLSSEPQSNTETINGWLKTWNVMKQHFRHDEDEHHIAPRARFVLEQLTSRLIVATLFSKQKTLKTDSINLYVCIAFVLRLLYIFVHVAFAVGTRSKRFRVRRWLWRLAYRIESASAVSH